MYVGVNRGERVYMGEVGCRGTGGHKNNASRDINDCAGHDLVPTWSGKIPRTSCFLCFAKNGQTWMQMGNNGCVWVQWGI